MFSRSIINDLLSIPDESVKIRPLDAAWLESLRGEFIRQGVLDGSPAMVVWIPAPPGAAREAYTKEEVEGMIQASTKIMIADGNHR